MSLTKRLPVLTLLALVGLNTLLASWGAGSILLNRLRRSTEATPSHTYLGNDYPLEYPVGPLDSVGLALHESARYTLNLSDTASNREWRTITVYPAGFGRTRLGPSHRLFVVTMFHQLHCVWVLRNGLAGTDPVATPYHVQHCLEYLRQTFLCEAAEGLEEGDFMERDWRRERFAGILKCRDWERVYDALDEDAKLWVEWAAEWN